MVLAQGTFSEPQWVITTINGATTDITTAIVANQYLKLWVAPFNCRIGGIQVNARTAGTGAGNTVLDILLNGSSAWPIHPGNRPTLAATSTGAFVLSAPEVTVIKQGDKVDLRVISISSTGHAGVSFVVTLERPRGVTVV